jgi:hypothetical protein
LKTNQTNVEDKKETKPSRVYVCVYTARYVSDRDVTALEWLRDIVGARSRVIALAESIYANDFGCSLATMGMHESIVEQKAWVYGEKYLVRLGTVTEVLQQTVFVRS